MARNPFARREFFANYVNILFMVLSLIQGLAFQDLAQKSRDVLPAAFAIDQATGFSTLLFVLIGLAVLIRVLQTYLTVALDYGPSYVSLHDILVIFAIGLLEAFLFNQLSVSQNGVLGVNHEGYWLWLGVLSLTAAVPYALNVKKVARKPQGFLSRRDMQTERVLQATNSLMMVALGGVSLLAYSLLKREALPTAWEVVAQVVSLVILVATTAISLSRTFGIRAFFEVDQPNWKVLPAPVGIAGTLSLKSRQAEDTDIPFLKALLMREHDDLLSEMFGVTRDRLEPLLDAFLQEDGQGTGAGSVLGYRHWVVVLEVVAGQGHGAVNEDVPIGAVLLQLGSSAATRANVHRAVPSALPGWFTRTFLTNTMPAGLALESEAVKAELGESGIARLNAKMGELFLQPLPADQVRLHFPLAKLKASQPGGKALLGSVLDKVLDEFASTGELAVIVIGDLEPLATALTEKGLGTATALQTTLTHQSITVWQR